MSEQTEHQNKDNLSASRAGSLKNSLQNAKKNIDAAKNIGSLMTHLELITDWVFGLALAAAALKDILDLVDTALIALGGLGVVLIFVSTGMASIVIAVAMFITSASGNSKVGRKIAKKISVLAGTTIIEFIPGIDVLPLETLAVIIIIWLTLVERKVAADKAREEAQELAQQNQTRKPNPDSEYTTTTAQQVA
ncbi:MAG: hypothetical protein Q7T51_01155 [Candidatus Moranbacteria bacterium]|nr:hypothetical protein [Candidatus Moranbacteria bacterium]